jgi:hypothetical protein
MTPSGLTPQEQQEYQRFRELMKDPIAGPELMKILNQPNTTMGQIGQISNLISKAKTPSQQLGAGLGGALGMGINALLKKRNNSNSNASPPTMKQMGQYLSSQSDYSGGDVNNVEPNLSRPAGPQDRSPAITSENYDPSEDMNYIEEARRGGVIGRKRRFAGGGDLEDAVSRKPPGREVLHRRPVISTTIVIAKKPPASEKGDAKPGKKARGGPIQARRPAAVPPRRGPADGAGPPAPFRKGGRVQAPRGSGIAQRGKRFTGIF